MSHPVKVGLYAGLLGLILIALFGGWSGILIGLVGGACAGLLADRDQTDRRTRTPQAGVVAGSVAGAIFFVGYLIRDFILAPLAGYSTASIPPFGLGTVQIAYSTLVAGLMTLIVAVLAGALLGYINTLPARSRRNGQFAVLIAFLALYPFLDAAAHLNWIETMLSVLVFIILALGLNIVVGYAGLLDLGYAAFFAIGAYTTGLLLSSHLCGQSGVNCEFYQSQWAFWLVIWIAAAVAALFGIILGAPTLPLRGDYLAIVTLGFGEIVPIVFRNLTGVIIIEPITRICLVGCPTPLNITGGERGINPIAHPWLPGIGTFETGQYGPWYVLILGIIALSIFFINRLRQSRLGRSWAAMREDELAASSMGIDIVRTKLLAFAMGATFSGFAGAFYGSYISAIFPSVFDFTISVIILVMVILGGLGNMAGVIVGALIVTLSDRLFLPEFAKLLNDILNKTILPNVTNPAVADFLRTSVDPTQWRLLLFGLTLVIMMLVRPEGLIPSARRKAELHAGEEPGMEALSIQEADAATQLQSIDARDVRAS